MRSTPPYRTILRWGFVFDTGSEWLRAYGGEQFIGLARPVESFPRATDRGVYR